MGEEDNQNEQQGAKSTGNKKQAMSNSDVQNEGEEEIDFALLKKDVNEFYEISEENLKENDYMMIRKAVPIKGAPR
jgi:hypothetical protein